MILAIRFQFEDIAIITGAVIIVITVLSLYLYRMNMQNMKHTTRLFVELSILITDFKKALERVKLFKKEEYATEIGVHEENLVRFSELLEQIRLNREKNPKIKNIFDIEKTLDIDTDTIKRKIRKEIRLLISYLQKA